MYEISKIKGGENFHTGGFYKDLSVGIDVPEKMIELGSKQVFSKLKEAYPSVCLVHLYTLEGAI